MNDPKNNQSVGFDEAQRQFRANLSGRHPEWAESDGDCPACAGYEHELAEVSAGHLTHHTLRPEETSENDPNKG